MAQLYKAKAQYRLAGQRLSRARHRQSVVQHSLA